MDVNVRVTVDLGDRTMALFSGMMAANESMKRATDTVHRVLEKYDSSPAPEPQAHSKTEEAEATPAPAPVPAPRSARVSRARRVAAAAPAPAPEPESAQPASAEAPDAEEPEARRADAVSRDDIRDLMADVIGADADNRTAALDWLRDHDARSVGTLKAEHLREFYDFLTDLKNK